MSQLDPWKQAADIIQKQMDTLRAQLEAVTRERDELGAKLRRSIEIATETTRERDEARAFAADRNGLEVELEAARETIQHGIELRQKAERELDAARESEARMRAALEGLLTTQPGTSDERNVAIARAETALFAPAPEPTVRRGGLTVRAGAPTCPACHDDDARRVGCRACGETGLADLSDVRPDKGPCRCPQCVREAKP